MNKTRRSVVGILAVLLAACAQPPVAQDTFYRLQVAPPAVALATPRLPGTLQVPRFAADGLMAGRPLVFSEAADPLKVEAYHYHFWIEPPGVMLRDELVGYLRAAGVARQVVTPELRLEPDFVLSARIRRIEQVRGAAPKVVVVLDVALNSRQEDRLLLLKTYRVETEAADNSVGAAVAALNGAMATVWAGIVTDIPAP